MYMVKTAYIFLMIDFILMEGVNLLKISEYPD